MAANALEEKINKIRQQNEEIRRRHEEVEEDKKNAAKLNALVQMVPSTDWPERKEPPEFSNPPRPNNKSKPAKEHHEQSQQYHSVSGEGRKAHTFGQGQGPPPDPKYNFLADAEREESNLENTKESPPNRGQKHSRGIYKRKSGGKDGMQRDYRMNRGPHRDEHQPEYEAWRAERNRIDEDRISRQRTAEGNWRREWDNDKVHIVDEVTRPEAKLGDYAKKDHKDFDRRYHVNGNDYASHNRGSHRSYRGNSKHFHYNYENRSNNMYQDGHVKYSLSPGSEERTVVATDKSLKVTLNQGNITKGPVMSVKVNSPSIAGTGRVGPRQRSRVTYSSHSDVEVTSPDTESFSRPKSYEDKAKGIHHDNGQKSPNSRKSQLPSRKKDFSNKSLFFRKKEIKREGVNESLQKHYEDESPRKEDKDLGSESYQLNSQKPENTAKQLQNDKILTVTNEKESNIICCNEPNANNTQVKSKDNHSDDLNSCMDEQNEIHANKEDETVLQNSDFLEFKVETVIGTSEKVENKPDESQIVETAAMSECEIIKTDLIASSVKDIDDNDENETKSVKNLLYDANYTKEIVENKEQNLLTEQTKEIKSNNCDNKQTEDMNKQENGIDRDTESFPEETEAEDVVILSSTDICSVVEENNKLESNNEVLKEKEILIVEDGIAATDEKITVTDKQDINKCINETQECTDNNDNEEKNNATINVIDKIESPKEDLQVEEEEKAASSKVIEIEKL